MLTLHEFPCKRHKSISFYTVTLPNILMSCYWHNTVFDRERERGGLSTLTKNTLPQLYTKAVAAEKVLS